MQARLRLGRQRRCAARALLCRHHDHRVVVQAHLRGRTAPPPPLHARSTRLPNPPVSVHPEHTEPLQHARMNRSAAAVQQGGGARLCTGSQGRPCRSRKPGVDAVRRRLRVQTSRHARPPGAAGARAATGCARRRAAWGGRAGRTPRCAAAGGPLPASSSSEDDEESAPPPPPPPRLSVRNAAAASVKYTSSPCRRRAALRKQCAPRAAPPRVGHVVLLRKHARHPALTSSNMVLGRTPMYNLATTPAPAPARAYTQQGPRAPEADAHAARAIPERARATGRPQPAALHDALPYP